MEEKNHDSKFNEMFSRIKAIITGRDEVKFVFNGVCHFFSETGTEGGFWAFQDSQFITKNVPRPYCKKCGKYLEPQKYENLKVVKVLPITQEVLDGKEPPECPEGQHEREVNDSWSYEGLRILKDGDHLTIYSKENPDEIVWEGNIKLREHPLFTEDASGLWIHADQEGVDRETWARWFFDEHPAILVTTITPLARKGS